MTRLTTTLAALLTAGFLSSIAFADAVVLQNGTRVEGDVKMIPTGYEVTLENGAKKLFTSEQVREVQLTPKTNITEDQARERLNSLRRAIDVEADIDRIIDRFEKLIPQLDKFPAVVADVKKDIEQWKARKAAGAVKVGKTWVKPEERQALFEKSLQTIDQIRSLAKEHRTNEAEQLVKSAIDDDPTNPSYLYLAGVAAVRRSAWAEAVRDFEEVSKQIGTHAPTVANRALLAVQLRRWPSSIALMEQALALEPGNPFFVDNCAELLQMLPDKERRGATYEKLVRRFNEQDAQLRKQFEERGLFRWGSSWVTREKLDTIKKDRESYESKKSDLQNQFNVANQDISSKQRRIESNERLMRQIQQDSIVTDVDGKIYRRPLPDTYWDLDRENKTLNSDIDDLQRTVRDLRRQASDLQKTEPSPPFQGSLVLVSEDGVPIVVPPGMQLPTTGPTTNPTDFSEDGPRIEAPSTQPTTQP
ncbi:MAG: tetratricopeptide repeat protein [Tepidisphaeraceae bacterium]